MGLRQCVRLARFENDRTISFIPPDGEFDLMTYRLSSQAQTRTLNLSSQVSTVTLAVTFHRYLSPLLCTVSKGDAFFLRTLPHFQVLSRKTKPETRKREPGILALQTFLSGPVHPKLETLNPKPETRNARPTGSPLRFNKFDTLTPKYKPAHR